MKRLVLSENTVGRKVLDYLKEHEYINKKIAIEKFGCDYIAQVIAYLKEHGVECSSQLVMCDGKKMTNYYLISSKAVDDQIKEEVKVVEEKPTIDTDNLKPEDMHIKTSMKQVIIDHLEKYGKINQVEAMKKYNCFNLSPMIACIKRDGYNVVRSTTKDKKDFNKYSNRTHAFSEYVLIKKEEKKSKYITSYFVNPSIEPKIGFGMITPIAKIRNNKEDAIQELKNLAYGLTNAFNVLLTDKEVCYEECYNHNKKPYFIARLVKSKKMFQKNTETEILAYASITEIVEE